MKKLQQLLCALLCLVLCVSLFPAALAEDAGTITPAEEPEEETGSIRPAEDPEQAGTPGEPVTATNYGIRIYGSEITSENLSGEKYYFDGDHTLVLSGSLYMGDGVILENYGCEGLVIVGLNASISTEDGVAVVLKKDTTITGTLYAEKMYGRDPVISAENTATVTVKDGSLGVYHNCDGVTNIDQLRCSLAITGGKWIFDHASLDASTLAAGVDKTAGIVDWNSVTLKRSHIAEPEGGYVGEYGAVYNVDGKVYYSRIRIEPDESTEDPTNYGIRIYGSEITSENLSGEKYYFDGDHTLTVSGSLYMGDGVVLENYGCEGLVIVGLNASISTEDGVAVVLKKDTTITGTLYAEKMYGRDPVISAENTATVTVKDGSLGVYHNCDGVTNIDQLRCSLAITGGKWIFDHASLDASTLAAGVDKTAGIVDWNSVTLKRSHIAEPEGGYVGEYGAVYNADGKVYYSRIRIKPLENPFVDVPNDSWYTTPVLWAYYNGITSGVDDTHFGPGITCTRSQVVTFLYAAAGKPPVASTDTGFVDVPPNAWYAAAVAWAVENGITSGTDATHFGPNKECTRSQVVTFLYAAAGKPPVASTDTGFVDVSPNAWYAAAVAWAVQNGITSGTDATHFGPNVNCTRSQVVTFLYAAAGKPWG